MLQELQNLGMSRTVEYDVLYLLNPIFVYKYIIVQPGFMEHFKLLYPSVLEISKIVLCIKTIIIIQTVNFSDTSSTYSKFKISSADGDTTCFVFKNLILNAVAFYLADVTNKALQEVKLRRKEIFT